MIFSETCSTDLSKIQSSANILQSVPSFFGLTESLVAVNQGSRGYVDICMSILI